jgi:hypothetical protein
MQYRFSLAITENMHALYGSLLQIVSKAFLECHNVSGESNTFMNTHLSNITHSFAGGLHCFNFESN